jgi:putative sterol carrier protein
MVMFKRHIELKDILDMLAELTDKFDDEYSDFCNDWVVGQKSKREEIVDALSETFLSNKKINHFTRPHFYDKNKYGILPLIKYAQEKAAEGTKKDLEEAKEALETIIDVIEGKLEIKTHSYGKTTLDKGSLESYFPNFKDRVEKAIYFIKKYIKKLK